MGNSASEIRGRFLALTGKLERRTITVPELGEVTVRELDGHARCRIEQAMIREETRESWRLLLISAAVIDPATDLQVFDDADIAALGKLPARVLDPIYEEAFLLARLGERAVEDAEKNSPGSPSDAGSSA